MADENPLRTAAASVPGRGMPHVTDFPGPR